MLTISEIAQIPRDLINLRKREDECLRAIEKSQATLDTALKGKEERRERRKRKSNGDDREK